MAVSPLNVLSLCAGVGGLDLGIGLARPDARTVCYVEWNHFAASVIAARAKDGCLDDAPVWDDVGSFDGGPWRGVVDCVAAGFPCQPVSLAGKRQGMADERFIWGDIVRIVRAVGPRYLFLENVPGILSADAGRFLGRVLGDVAELGFAAEWDVFSAAETGAPHRRERWFLLGLADASVGGWGAAERDDDAGQPDIVGRVTTLGNTYRSGRQEPRQPVTGAAQVATTYIAGTALADTEVGVGHELGGTAGRREPSPRSVYPPTRNDVRGWAELIAADPSVEPAVRRDADGLASGLDASLFAYRADRLRSIGNGVVPLTAALAWTTLAGRLGVEP